MKVINQHGHEFGRVNSLLETGANDVLVVTPTTESIDARERLIPYVADIIIDNIDSKARLIRVNWEADYLE
jgi:16S rRNA processing protein RimM